MVSARILLFIFLAFATTSCRIYSFPGTSTFPWRPTFSIELFDNKASNTLPGLATTWTETLTTHLLSDSRLKYASEFPDLEFSGAITRYDLQPVAITGNEVAALTRLTISLHIVHQNHRYPDDSWTQTFTQFADFSSEKNLAEVEDELVKGILEDLAEDVFRKLLSNW